MDLPPVEILCDWIEEHLGRFSALLAYKARIYDIATPRGRIGKGGKWWPYVAKEGKWPEKKRPTPSDPFKLYGLCKSFNWCEQLPLVTQQADALAALEQMRLGHLDVGYTIEEEFRKWTKSQAP